MKGGLNWETVQAGLRSATVMQARGPTSPARAVSAFFGAWRKVGSWVFLKNLGRRSREDHAAAFQASCAEVQQQADSVSGRLQVIDHLRDMR
jgi:hypothetical protein